MDTLDDLSCPVCMRGFKTKKGCNSHMKTAQSCSWYRRGKLAELEMLDLEGEGGEVLIRNQEISEGGSGGDSSEMDQDPQEVMDDIEWDDNLFDFVPLPGEDVALGEAGPGPSTVAAAAARLRHRVLDDDDDTRVEDVFEGAGKVIRMHQTLHQRWKELFQENGAGDGDVIMEDPTPGNKVNAFYPFASELDWRVANWAIRESPGNNAFDRFLSIPGVSICFQGISSLTTSM